MVVFNGKKDILSVHYFGSASRIRICICSMTFFSFHNIESSDVLKKFMTWVINVLNDQGN